MPRQSMNWAEVAAAAADPRMGILVVGEADERRCQVV